jgi:hypothetical protein
VAQSLLPSGGATYPSSETDIFRTSEAMRCVLSGLDDPSARVDSWYSDSRQQRN